jgi:cobalamin biosynthesis protein CobD/CbiB
MVRGFAHYYREKSMMFLESKSLVWYVKSIAAARKAFIGTVALSSLILVLFTGFALIHLGLFFLLPWTLATRATIMLVLGLIYFGAALAVLMKVSSEKFFMQKSKASEMVDRFVKKQKQQSQP